MCISEHWSKRELEKQFSNCLYEKTVDSDSGSKLIPHTLEKDPSAHFRDEYNLGFLGLKEPFSEKDLQTAIVHNLRDFFLEFGKHLSFIGEEYPVTVVGTEQ
jgi:predicted nuclease of restriction endonuclease-like (RecB) superfamily